MTASGTGHGGRSLWISRERACSTFSPFLEEMAPCCLQETKADFWPFALMIGRLAQGLSPSVVSQAEATRVSTGRSVSLADTGTSHTTGRLALCLSLPDATCRQSRVTIFASLKPASSTQSLILKGSEKVHLCRGRGLVFKAGYKAAWGL